MFIDPDGLCREVGTLLTWIDCGKPSCPTSSLRQPTRYYSGDNKPKHSTYVQQHQRKAQQKKLEEKIVKEQTEIVISLYQSEHVPKITATGKIASAGISIGKGVGLLLVPDPTPINDIIAVRTITFGIVNFVIGAVKLIKEHLK